MRVSTGGTLACTGLRCAASCLPMGDSGTGQSSMRACAGVGSINNTFGCPGVEEHTQFFKSVEDARKFRRKVLQCFERAALPQTSSEVSCCLLEQVESRGWDMQVMGRRGFP